MSKYIESKHLGPVYKYKQSSTNSPVQKSLIKFKALKDYKEVNNLIYYRTLNSRKGGCQL